MSIQLISISHKTAPLHVRELFAFSESEQLEIMRKIIQSPVIEETVIIATCNRTEVYTYRMYSQTVFIKIQKQISAVSSVFITEIKPSAICLKWPAVWIPWSLAKTRF